MRVLKYWIMLSLVFSPFLVHGQRVRESGESGVRNTQIVAVFKELSWQVEHQQNKPSVRLISKESVFLLAKEMLDWQDFEIPRISIPELQVKDVNNDGMYEIVATVDLTCTVCPNLIIIINRGDSLKLYEIPDEYASLGKDLVDLDRNGTYEIIAKSPLNAETLAGPHYLPWVDIYEWDGEGYAKANKRFTEYYKNVYIPENERSIRELQTLLQEIEEGTRVFEHAEEKERKLGEIKNSILNRQIAITKAKREVLGEL